MVFGLFHNCYDCHDGKHTSQGHGVEMQILHKMSQNNVHTDFCKTIDRHVGLYESIKGIWNR